MHRQRYASRRRKVIVARFTHFIRTSAIARLYQMVQSFAKQLALRDSLYVIWAYSQHLQSPDFQLPNDIEVAPQFLAAVQRRAILAEWTLEQIAREVIQYAQVFTRGRKSLREWGTLAEVANALRDLEGEIHTRLVGGRRIHLELMRISHRQFVWQQHRPNARLIIRYYKLFNTSEIIALSKKVTGLSIDQIYLIGMAYLGIFLEHLCAMEQINVEIPGLTQKHIDLFLRFTSLSVIELRQRLREQHALDEDFAYRYSSLREFPLVRISYHGVAEIACPIPTLLAWRMTIGLYYTLRVENGFSPAFGGSFQGYVGEVLRRRMTTDKMQVLAETEYQVGKDRKDTVDWIVQQGDEAALFIECKTKRLTWAAKVNLADLSALEHDIRKLAGAVIQVYRTIKDYRDNLYAQVPFVVERHIYPVIVTLEDWYFFGQELPVRLDAVVRTDMAKAGLPLDWLTEMPYSIMSVDELEKVTGVINTVGVHRFISGKALDAELRYWTYGAYCNEQFSDAVRGLPPLFDDEYDALFAELGA
jgi:hypothetical protein